jgi:hypothetical protein
MTNRQYSGQKERKGQNHKNDQQNITQKSKDRETRIPLTTGDEPM